MVPDETKFGCGFDNKLSEVESTVDDRIKRRKSGVVEPYMYSV